MESQSQSNGPFSFSDQEEENEGIKREMAEIKSNETPEVVRIMFSSSNVAFQAHELRNRIEELESQLKSFQSDYADLMQMDQADREATLEAIKLKYLREKDILIEREETIQALQVLLKIVSVLIQR